MTEPTLVTVPEAALRGLAEVDPVMAAIIESVGPLDYRVDPDVWRALVGAIVGQQLSVAAARTIRGRVAALGANGFPEPDELLALPEERLRQCGLSGAKVTYVRDLADNALAGELDAAEIGALSDAAVIERLVRVRGIGRWTAEMFLIFSLGRPDVLSCDDLGLRVGMQRAYELADRPDRVTMETIGDRWKPFRSFASLYLWRSLEAK